MLPYPGAIRGPRELVAGDEGQPIRRGEVSARRARRNRPECLLWKRLPQGKPLRRTTHPRYPASPYAHKAGWPALYQSPSLDRLPATLPGRRRARGRVSAPAQSPKTQRCPEGSECAQLDGWPCSERSLWAARSCLATLGLPRLAPAHPQGEGGQSPSGPGR